MDIRHQFTAPYTSQENPTDRSNRTAKTMIAQVSGKQHNTWDKTIPQNYVGYEHECIRDHGVFSCIPHSRSGTYNDPNILS